MTATIAANEIEVISINDYNEAVVISKVSGGYFMGDLDGDVFAKAFNVKFAGGARDDVRAVAYFTDKYGFEAA